MKVLYFGEIADKTNRTEEKVDSKIKRLQDLLIFLKNSYDLSIEDIHIAINHELVDANDTIELVETDEVAILSPFAGG